MGKKAVTWIDVIREQLAKLRKEGKSPSVGDVTPAAKKEWADIKAGKHPLYMQGTSKGKGTSKGTSKGKGKGKGTSKDKGKTQKMSKQSMSKQSLSQPSLSASGNPAQTIQTMLSSVHLCKKDVAKIQKYIKTLKTQKGGGCGCDQTGGRKRQTTKKMRGKKMQGGGDETKEPYIDFAGKDGLEELDEDADGKDLDITAVEEV